MNTMLDVAVIGGGPAGAAVAFRLARLGYAVAVIHAPRPAPFGAMEVLPPTIHHLATTLPLSAALEGAVKVLGTRLLWSGGPEWVPPSADTRLVARPAFDAALLASCAVPVLAARARAPRRHGGIWHIELARQGREENAISAGTDNNRGTPFFPLARVGRAGVGISNGQEALTEQSGVTARVLVDASGRAGGVFGKAPACGPPTAAIMLQWKNIGLEPGTLLTEALNTAWCWGAAGQGGEMQIALFCDPRRCAGLGRAAIADMACKLLGNSTLFSKLLAGAQLIACRVGDATARVTAEPAGEFWLRVGDAACAADPLSSQGVCAALRLGIQAAAVLHTMLGAGDPAAALAFYRSRVAETSARSRRMAAEIYAQRRGTGENQFWQDRATAKQSFAHAAPPAAAIATVPALVGEHIEYVPAIVDPSSEYPIAWVGAHSIRHMPKPLYREAGG